MVSPRDYRLSRKSMLINVPGYLQSRKELYSSIFEEIHEHRIQSYKMLLEDFPLPSSSLLSKFIKRKKEKLTLLNMLKL